MNEVTTVELANGLVAEVKMYRDTKSVWNRNRSGRYEVQTNKKARIYVDIKNESLAENLMNRRNRPVAEYRKVVNEVLELLEVDGKISWSQNAGCDCACSPGFILSNSPWQYATGYNFAITINAPALKNDGYITPLEAYGFGEFVATPTFEEAVAVDMAAC